MVEINRNACTGCGQCISDCIANNLFLREGKAEVSGNCILCGHCVAVCPLNAVSIPEYDMGDVEELSREQAGLDTATPVPETSRPIPGLCGSLLCFFLLCAMLNEKTRRQWKK